jgi:hypothetical protein
MEDQLFRIQDDAMWVFHHYGIVPPDPMDDTHPAA